MQKDSPAAIGECYCSRLFKLEQAFAELTPEERYEKRLEQEKPVLDALLSWANEMQAKTAPYAFLLHGYYHLKHSGVMAIVLPHGILFRGAAEGKIRKKLEIGPLLAPLPW